MKNKARSMQNLFLNRYEGAISKPKFFETRSSYVLIQVNPEPDKLDLKEFQARYSHIIASTLRFETEILSEEQTKEILESAVGYFKDERIIIDTDVAFAYEEGYEEILDLLNLLISSGLNSNILTGSSISSSISSTNGRLKSSR